LAHIHVFDDWLEPVFSRAASHVEMMQNAEQLERTLLAPGLAALVLGAGFAYWMYMVHRGQPAEALSERFPRLYRWALDKWRVDELYQATVIWFVDSVAEVCTWIDKWVVDGIVARLTAAVVAGTGALLRLVQTGRVHAYAAVMVGGVALMGWFLLSPQAVAKLEANPATGTYVLKATPGLGYSYRWDDDGDGKFDTEEFRGNALLKVDLERNETRYIGLEVRNALGRIASERFEITRPPEDLSGARPTVIDVDRRRDGRLRGAARQPEPRRPRRPAAEPGDKP
jgi:NADH-quinone oxidoreductase subunit L